MPSDDEADVTQQICMLVPFTPMQFGMKDTTFPA